MTVHHHGQSSGRHLSPASTILKVARTASTMVISNPNTTTTVEGHHITNKYRCTIRHSSTGNASIHVILDLTFDFDVFDSFLVVLRSSDDENEMLYSPKKASPKPSPMTSRKYMGLGLMQSNTHNSPPSLPADFSDLASVTSNDVDLTSSPGSPRRKVTFFS